jgi:hypothetical protein
MLFSTSDCMYLFGSADGRWVAPWDVGAIAWTYKQFLSFMKDNFAGVTQHVILRTTTSINYVRTLRNYLPNVSQSTVLEDVISHIQSRGKFNPHSLNSITVSDCLRNVTLFTKLHGNSILKTWTTLLSKSVLSMPGN